MAPDICQVSSDTSQRNDVDRGFNRPLEAKEKRRPDEVEGQLDSVEGGTVLAEFSNALRLKTPTLQRYLCENDLVRVKAVHASCPSSICCISHCSIQAGPYRSEDPWWRSKGWLAKVHIRLLSLFGRDRESHCGAGSYGQEDGSSGLLEEDRWEGEGRDVGRHGGLFDQSEGDIYSPLRAHTNRVSLFLDCLLHECTVMTSAAARLEKHN